MANCVHLHLASLQCTDAGCDGNCSGAPCANEWGQRRPCCIHCINSAQKQRTSQIVVSTSDRKILAMQSMCALLSNLPRPKTQNRAGCLRVVTASRGLRTAALRWPQAAEERAACPALTARRGALTAGHTTPVQHSMTRSGPVCKTEVRLSGQYCREAGGRTWQVSDAAVALLGLSNYMPHSSVCRAHG